jgi:hypothetical protein
MNESHNHEVLKLKALEWLYLHQHCRYLAREMQVGPYIFDVVGSDGARVFIIEAKQSKEDFKADCNRLDEIKQKIQEYKKKIVETGDLRKYKKLIKNERAKSYKFDDKTLLKLSTLRYIIAPDGLVQKEEVPEMWGLLNEEPRMIKESPGNVIDKRIAEKVVKIIAKKQTKLFLESLGVKFDKVVEFPQGMLI